MQHISKQNNKRKIAILFLIIWLVSFVGGCSAKLIYQANNNAPDWLNSIVVGAFVGLVFCSMSITIVSGNFADRWQTKSSENKFKAIYSLILGIPFFIISLGIFWKVLLNILALIP